MNNLPIGKVFVHEWAHYRYGVFDEYGTPGDPEFPLFYRSQATQSIVPNICVNAPLDYTVVDISNNSTTCKIDPATNLYDKNCRFILSNDFKPTSSLTSYHHLESVRNQNNLQSSMGKIKSFCSTGCPLLQ